MPPSRQPGDSFLSTRDLIELAQRTRNQILLAAHDLTKLTEELRRQVRAIENAGEPRDPPLSEDSE